MSIKCHRCGVENDRGAQHCIRCGARFAVGAPPGAPRNRRHVAATKKAQATRSQRTLTVAVGVVAVLLTVAVVVMWMRQPEPLPVPTGPDDSTPFAGAQCYFEALGDNDWQAVYATLSSQLKSSIGAQAFATQAAVFSQQGLFYAKPFEEFSVDDQGDLAQLGLIFMAVDCGGSAQAVYLKDEDGHYKVVWSNLLGEGFRVDVPALPAG